MRTRRDLFTVILFGLVAMAAALAVDPRGDFPLNDDWAYSESARRLAQQGDLRLSDWVIPTALPQIFLGAAVTRIAGFSHEHLRALAHLLGWLCAVLLFRILRERSVPLSWAVLAAGLLFFNPIFYVLSLSFHTDVPFLCAVLAAVHFYHRAQITGSARAEIGAAIFAAAAGLTRQPGFLLPLGATLWYSLRRQMTWARAARLWVIPLAAAGLWHLWFTRVHGATWAYSHLVETAGGAEQPGAKWLPDLISHGVASLLYAALFAAGILFVGRLSGAASPGTPPPGRGKDRWNRSPRALIASLLAVALFGYVLIHGSFPYLPNTWTPKGLGVITMGGGAAVKSAAGWDVALPWFFVTLGSALALAVSLRRAIRNPWNEGQTFFAILIAPLALSFLIAGSYYDRYTLSWLLIFLFFGALRVRGPSRPRWGWIILAVWIGVSLAGTRDYFVWNRAKWTLGAKAQELGIPPEDLDNGFDWNASWNYERNMAELKRAFPLSEIDQWDWNSVRPRPAAIVQERARPPETRVLAEQRYRSPLAPAGAVLLLVKHP